MNTTVRTAAVALLVVSCALLSGSPPALAQDAPAPKTKAKELLAAASDAVIHVKAALKMRMLIGGSEMGGENDEQVEVLGTVIDPSGLTVLSEASLNPGGMLEAMGGMMGGSNLEVKSDVGDVKMVLADGKEVPARVVLRDKDLDLAFVVPIDKGGKYTSVSLDAAKAPQLLDDLIFVGRLRRNLDRTPIVGLGHVGAIVKKPRTFYVADTGGPAIAAGCPAFDASGKLLGILLQRRGPAAGGGGLADLISGMTPVILPADDVQESAEQALAEAAKPPKEEPKTETPKPEEPAPKGEGETVPPVEPPK